MLIKVKTWLHANYWLLVIMTTASVLRIYHADYQSFWLDEVLTMNDTNPDLDFGQFYDSVLLWEAFPHLYFLLLKYFLLIFGYSTWVARIFSAIIGIFGVYAIYLFGKELFNKRTGLIAAALTCVSIYHITYSQEARPYGMLFLFTVLSFYRLVIFIRRPTYINAVYYGIFTGLIVNSHFFGLLTLFSQFLFFLLIFFQHGAKDRKEFFLKLLVAAFFTLLLIIPTYEPLLQIANIKSFWIPKPGQDSFTVMFKEFFGNSEMLIYVINILLINYFVRVFGQKAIKNSTISIIENRTIFSFILLFIWLIVSLMIPLIKSVIDVSIILTRYFINIIPVFLIAIAIGVDLIRINMVRHFVISCLIIFSLCDLFIVKDYYNKPSKCQMRELTNSIKLRNDDNSKVVVFYSWVFPFFFKDAPI